MNNLFSFATKELSQDAFLCWIINAISENDYPVASLGKDLLNAMTGLSKDIPEHYRDIKIYRQYKRIDILIVFYDENGQHVLIVEDKTFSTEHDNQIKNYTEIIEENVSKGIQVDNEGPKFDTNAILHLCYFKTGVWSDEEKYTSKRRFNISERWLYTGIDAEQFLSILDKHQKTHCLVEMFTEYLFGLQAKLREIENAVDILWDNIDTDKKIQDQYGQLYLARKLFLNRGLNLKRIPMPTGIPEISVPIPCYNYIYSGSSHGTPWTQYCFWGEGIKEKDWNIQNNIKRVADSKKPLAHYLFWRIDTDRISLRYYSHYPFDEGSYQDKTLKECFGIADSIGRHPNRSAAYEFSLLEKKFGEFTSYVELEKYVRDIHSRFISAFNQIHVNNPAIEI